MNSAAYLEFVALLRARGVIPEKAPPVAAADRPWFIALLQGAAGWLAGIFLLSFIGFIFKPDSTGAIFGFGALLLVAAWALYRADRDAVFLDQLALAFSIAGQSPSGGESSRITCRGCPLRRPCSRCRFSYCS
jgi:hypothetical protein